MTAAEIGEYTILRHLSLLLSLRVVIFLVVASDPPRRYRFIDDSGGDWEYTILRPLSLLPSIRVVIFLVVASDPPRRYRFLDDSGGDWRINKLTSPIPFTNPQLTLHSRGCL